MFDCRTSGTKGLSFLFTSSLYKITINSMSPKISLIKRQSYVEMFTLRYFSLNRFTSFSETLLKIITLCKQLTDRQ